jgi:hypothetical protein
VGVSLGVPVEVELHARKPCARVEVPRQLAVGKRVDDRGRFGPGGLGPVRRRRQRLRESEHGESGRRHRRVAEPPGRSHRPLDPVLHAVVPRAPELVRGQLRQEANRLGRILVGQALERVGEPGARLVVATEQALDGGARPREPRAQRVRPGRDEGERFQERLVAVGIAARRGQRVGESREELDALLRRRRPGKQAERVGEPVGGAGRREANCRLAGLTQDSGCFGISLARRALDVMGPCRRCRSACRQRPRAAVVGAEPPGARGRLVDGAPDERMPEPEASWHVRSPHEIEPEKLVDRVHGLGLGRRGRGCGQLGLEGIAGDRRPFEDEPGRAREKRQLLRERRGHGRRDADRLRRRLLAHGRRARPVGRSGQLLEVEWVAAALVVEGVGFRAADELPRLVAAQRAELDPCQELRPVCPLERGGEALRQLARANGEREQHRRRRHPAQERPHELDGGSVGPVQVVETEHDRLERGESLEQRAHRPVAAIALVLQRHGGSRLQREERREDVRKLSAHVVVEGVEAARVEPAHVLVDRVHEHGERQVALELGRGAEEDEATVHVRAGAKLREQPGLADPGLAQELDDRRLAAADAVQNLLERAELLGATDELPTAQRHSLPSSTSIRKGAQASKSGCRIRVPP